MAEDDSIWNQMIMFVGAQALNLKELGKTHEISKLDLEALTAEEILQKKTQLKNAYRYRLEESSKNWMENEYRIFIWFIFALSKLNCKSPQSLTDKEWKIVGSQFEKDSQACKYFYFCSLKVKTKAWSKSEDQLLKVVMLNRKFSKKWTEVGLQIFRRGSQACFRKPKAIRQRWLSHLNPQIKKYIYKQFEGVLDFGRGYIFANGDFRNGEKVVEDCKIHEQQIRAHSEKQIQQTYHQTIESRPKLSELHKKLLNQTLSPENCQKVRKQHFYRSAQ